MTEFFYDLLKASFHGSIVILAVLLLRQLLKKAPRSVFCLLWLLAGLRLVLPFEIESNLSLQPQIQEQAESIQITLSDPVTQPEPSVDSVIGEPERIEWPEGTVFHTAQGTPVGPVESKPAITVGNIAAGVWILGMAVMLAASAVSYIRLKRRVRMAYLIENGCFECPGLETAFVLGFLPPKIYLPAGLTDDEKKFIFDHENTHIARHDHWYKLLGYLVLSLHWFNPLVWVGYSALCRDIELACDEHVVKYMSLAQRKAYSAALLSCGGQTARIAACPVAFGESNPKKRILNVLNYKRPTFWISLTAIIAVIFVAVCLLTSPGSDPQQKDDDSGWNLEMTVSDVTPSGLQVQFRQTGIFPGSDRANLQYGSYYTLERWEDGAWTEVEMLPQEYEVAWTLEAYLIDLNSTNAFNVDWEWLYGQLPAGRYRIGKDVDLYYRIEGETEHQMFYAEFEIAEMQPAWTMDMTDEEYMAMCRNGVAELQSREQFHITETLAYFTGDKEDSRSDVTFWRDGENRLRQSYVTRRRENHNHLYYEGYLYFQVQGESGDPSWTRTEISGGPEYGLPWLCLLKWDEQGVTFEGTAQEGEELRVSVTVHTTPPTLGWDDVQVYNILFFFDKTGTMTRAIMTAQRDNLKVIDDLKIETTLAANIHNKLETFAAQRPDAPQVKTEDEAWLEKCREAMLALKNSKELYLYVTNLDDPMETTNVYMHASNGWLFQYRRPGWDCEAVQWLRVGNAQYIYGGDMDDNGVMTMPYYWQAEQNPDSHNYQLPYPFDLDWENIELVCDGTAEEFGFETVNILFPSYLDTFDFHFSPEGELLYFDVGDSTGEPEAITSRFYVSFPYDGTVADYLEGLFGEASTQAGRKPAIPDDAFYEELFTRVTDGHDTEQWVYDLFRAFYASPKEFVSRLAGHERAEEIITHMGYSLEIYAPYRFAAVLNQLREDPKTDSAILTMLEACLNGGSQTEQQWQDKCRNALESYQAQGSWVVMVENTFTGDGAMNPYSTALWHIDGQDWYKQAITGSADFTSEHCYLKTAGKTYCRENHTIHDPANGEGFSTGWTEDSQYADMPLPWPLSFTWDEASLEYVQTEQWDRGEKITFTVRGSLYAGEQRGIDSYQVTFWLTEKGELWSIDMTYTEKDGMGETINVRSVITPNAAAPEEAAKMIELKYQEANR